MAKKLPSISVFFPCYNDEKTIGQLVKKVFDTASTLTNDYEVIVIDDSSVDKSRQVLSRLARKYKKLRLIFHNKNKGYGGALKSGFATASKDLIFYTDGDGQYDVRELTILLPLMTADVDFVNGIKMSRSDPAYRIFFGNLHKFITRWAFWLPIYDVDCDFRLIRRDLLKRIRLDTNSGSICTELVKKAQRAGATFREVSVHHYERRYGQSQFFRPSKILSTYANLALLWIRLMVVNKIFS